VPPLSSITRLTATAAAMVDVVGDTRLPELGRCRRRCWWSWSIDSLHRNCWSLVGGHHLLQLRHDDAQFRQ